MTWFCAVIGLAYVSLGLWCAAQPGQTSSAVGFQLAPGSGQSEYFVVYGGLQLALGLLFLSPLLWPHTALQVVRAILLIHACLVLFRTVSFLRFSGISSTTYILAGVEWAILLAALAVFVASRPSP